MFAIKEVLNAASTSVRNISYNYNAIVTVWGSLKPQH